MPFFRLACLLLVLGGSLSSCGNLEDQLLVGDWQATLVEEAGDSLRLDPAEIGFSFTQHHRYQYRSTLKYREAGTWRLDNGFLFAQDTTEASTPQRIVAIEKLTTDSLELRMRAGEQEQRMVLLRQ